MKSDTSKPGVQGEGDYVSGRKYQEQARAFAESGKVKDAAERAAPRDQQEQDELLRAEAEGRAHAKGGEPAKGVEPGPPKTGATQSQQSSDAGKGRPQGQAPEPEKPGR